MADALASGASVRKDVGVQVPPRPQPMEANLDPNTLSVITWFKGTELFMEPRFSDPELDLR